jgi:hypothetical protein
MLKILAVLAVLAAVAYLVRRSMKQAERRRLRDHRRQRLDVQQRLWSELADQYGLPEASSTASRSGN